MTTQLFYFGLVLEDESPGITWWTRAHYDYMLGGGYEKRVEHLNMRPYIEEAGGVLPFAFHFKHTRERHVVVCFTPVPKVRSNTTPVATLISKYLREFDLPTKLLIPYAVVPLDGNAEGPFGGGVVEITRYYVSETTTSDLMVK